MCSTASASIRPLRSLHRWDMPGVPDAARGLAVGRDRRGAAIARTEVHFVNSRGRLDPESEIS